MGIKNVLGSAIGFIGGLVPTVMKLGEALTVLLGLIKVGIATGDKEKLIMACDVGDALAEGFERMGKEVREFFALLRTSLADGELDGHEIKALAGEADDIPPVAIEIGAHVTAITKLAYKSF